MFVQKEIILSCCISVIIHIFLLIFVANYIIVNKESEQKPNKPSGIQSIELIPKTNKEPNNKIIKKGDSDKSLSISTPRKCTDQNKYYEGVGIKYNIFTGIIDEVSENYPAFRAGIKPGDKLIITYDTFSISNGFMILKIDRNGKFRTYKLKVEKICYTI